jgi:hypothetical protein
MIHLLSSGQIQQHKSHDDLVVSPALITLSTMYVMGNPPKDVMLLWSFSTSYWKGRRPYAVIASHRW